jgi:hypothetical protein
MMLAISAAELLNAWEEGSAKASAERAVELLALVFPESARERLNAFSIGRRDVALLTLRERLFGSRMVGVVLCPDCGERLDFPFDTREIFDQDPTDEESDQELEPEIAVSVEDYELRCRPVNTGDALAITAQTGAGQTNSVERPLDLARGVLLQRCLLSAKHAGVAIESEEIPPEVAEIAVERMAKADPMADIHLAMTCPSCARQWSAALDIVSFLWSEIEVWAWRLLHDVHTLASAYGWREQDILTMSANRRQCYLRMVWA